MTSNLQQPRHAAEQPARCFVAFPFRLHAHAQPRGSRDVRCLDRQVMCQSEERGFDRVDSGVCAVGFVRHGRHSVVRCEVIFDEASGNDTHVLSGEFAPACVTQITDGASHV